MKRILKKRIKLITMIITLFMIVNITISFSYLRGKSTGNESVSTVALSGGRILVRYSSNTGAIAVSDINPGYEGNKQFTITSDFGENHEYYVDGIWYTVVLVVEKNEFDTNSIQYSLSLDSTSQDDGITLSNIQNKGIPAGTNTSGIILGSGRFETHNKKHVYNLKISYPDNGTDQSHEIGCEFHAYIDFINTNMVGLTFDLDGGSFTNLNLNEKSSIKVPANSTINLPIPNKEGYIFAGWEVVSGDVSTNINVISTGNGDISIKALWNDNIPYEFDYTGGEQQFIADVPGYYKLEVWGAQGGNAGDFQGGYGGYSIGKIRLQNDELLYVNVGGRGGSTSAGVALLVSGGYNGGGSTGGQNCCGRIFGSGGGATHIAQISGELPGLEQSKNFIFLIAGGGGGSYYGTNDGTEGLLGGSGGGHIGGNGIESAITNNQYCAGLGGSQNAGGAISTNCSQTSNYNGAVTGAFGKGGTSTGAQTGGGGGYFGGSNSGHIAPGGGGSGYIGNSLLTDKYMYCYNCEPSSVESTKTYTTTCVNETPTENCAKKGNGYARITYLHS